MGLCDLGSELWVVSTSLSFLSNADEYQTVLAVLAIVL